MEGSANPADCANGNFLSGYYVSIYFSRKAEPKDIYQLLELALKYEYKSFGTSETIPSLSQSADPGSIAFLFDGTKQASGFTEEVLGLEYILNVRLGLFR